MAACLMVFSAVASFATTTNPNNDAYAVTAPSVDYSGTFVGVGTYITNLLTGPGAYAIELMLGFIAFRFVWHIINKAMPH